MNSFIQNQTNLVKNILYKRNHPFYPEWKNWVDHCVKYNSNIVSQMVGLSKAYTEYLCIDDSLSEIQRWTVSLSVFERDWFLCKTDDFPESKEWHKLFYKLDYRQIYLGLCSCDEENYPVYQWGKSLCDRAINHKQAHILGFINAYRKTHNCSKSVRKYYDRLSKVILSLDEEHLDQFTPDLVTDPPKYMGRGRFLLRELYSRGYFDKPEQTNDITLRIEYLKHFVKQQSGANQSGDADCWQQIVKQFELVNQKFTLDELLQFLKPKQQGFFSVKHEHQHVWNDADFEKLQGLVSEAQTSFFDGMKECITGTVRNLAILFLTAATVSLLARVAIDGSARIIVKLLHFIYAFVCGVDHHEHVKSSEKATQQSLDQEELSIPFLPAMVLEYVISPPKKLLRKLWQSTETDKCMRRIGYLGDIKIERGIDRLVEIIRNIVKQVQTWYYRHVLGLEIQPDIDSTSHEIVRWNEQVDDLLKDYYAGTFVWSDASFNMIYKLYSTGLKFTRSQCYVKYKNDVWKIVSKLSNILELFKVHQRSGTTIRNPPVTLYLAGGTGVGKSSLTYPLAAEILQKVFEKEGNNIDLEKHWQDFIYMRSPEQEYWDGYENQLVTVFDDFSQVVDSSSNPNLELFEIIRASNCFPYPLHMASIEQKACTNFTSKIIIVSSNLEKPDTHSLNFPTALHRRFDICVRVGRKPESEGKVYDEFNPDIYTFQLYDMTSGAALSTCTYQELIQLATDKYQGRRDYVDSIHKYIQKKLAKSTEPLVDLPVFEPNDDPDDLDNLGSLADGMIAKVHAKEFAVQQMFALNQAGNIVNFENVKISPPWSCSLRYYKDKLISYFSKNPWDSLKESSQNLMLRYGELQSSWTKFKDEHPYLSKIAITMAMMTAGLMFLKVFFSIKNLIQPKKKLLTPEEYIAQESYSPSNVKVAKKESYGEVKPNVAKRESQRIVRNNNSELASEQGVKDLNASEVLMKLARSNMYKMYIDNGKIPVGHVLFLVGKVALMPRHYLDALKNALAADKDSSVYFECVLLRRSFATRIDDLLKNFKTFESPNEDQGPVFSRDLAAVVVNNSIMHADATKLFVSRDAMGVVDNTAVMLPVLVNDNCSIERAVLLLRFSEGRSQLKRLAKLPVYDDDEKLLRYVRDVWEYNMDTRAAECGAPLIVRNTLINPGKVCGIHVAGIEGTGQGFATPVYIEDTHQILKMFDEEHKYAQVKRLELKEFPTQQGQVPSEAEFIRLGAIRVPLAQPGFSKIEPSLCHASYKEPETKPCALGPRMVDGERFDPRSYRLSRLGNICVPLRQDMIDNAKEALVDEISQEIGPRMDILSRNIKSVYTFEEAIKGVDGELYVNSIKRNTSPGFPFVQMKGQQNRKQFFGDEMEYDLTSPQCLELKTRVEEIIEAAKKGVVLDHYFIDTLKDERKPIHKAHKTRLFAAGPMDYLIACKMYYNGVVALLQHNRNWCHVSVGTNPYSLDWGEIVSTLRRKSENMVAGDFEGFDASQHMMLLQAAGDVLIQLSKRFLFSTTEDIRVMRVLLVSLINSMHITGTEVYQWTHSLPSGHYLTAVINSIFVNLAFGCIWQINKQQISYNVARHFWKVCGIVAYGDDHIVSVPDNELETFNQETLPFLFQKIGLSYTMEDKDAKAEKPARSIFEVSYLKRTFARDMDMNRWVAPLSLSTILETPMWLHRTPDKRAQTVANLEWALKELSLHDAKTWQSWAPYLQLECRKLQHYTIYRDQEYTKRVCLDQDFDM